MENNRETGHKLVAQALAISVGISNELVITAVPNILLLSSWT